MFDHESARNDLTASLTDAQIWHDKPWGDPERVATWSRLCLVYKIALDTLEAVLDRHNGITCHPDADCDHEEPSFGYILSEIPTTAYKLASLRTPDLDIALLAAEKLLYVIGITAQLDRWARENGE
jgi:hypothetical protein